jgi:exopolysaccharide biosynthesis protein
MGIYKTMLVIAMVLILPLFVTDVFSDMYEKKIINAHIIHIVRLNPDEYEAEIVKANNGKMGRETVSAMAEKFSADIAINGGFFEVGGENDGKSSGNLVIHGKPYHMDQLSQPSVVIKNGIISVHSSVPEDYTDDTISCVSGIPMLIYQGKIPVDLLKQTSDFYLKPHARTALGINAVGGVIIVVAEHYYMRDIMNITMGEVQSLMKSKAAIFAQKYNKQNPGDITLNELKKILKDEFSSSAGTQGLTVVEVAQLMQELGCQYAINLDGGGSSTLWMYDKVVNNTFGDADEAAGKKIERSVSDAIIFKKR